LFIQALDDPHIGFKIRDRTGMIIFETNTFCMKQKFSKVESGTLWDIRFKFKIPLMEGEYTITVGVGDSGYGEGQFERTLIYAHNVMLLKVLRNKSSMLWSGIVNLSPSLTIIQHNHD
jgi:lipopolysaccharide transport system ATP-binding protein